MASSVSSYAYFIILQGTQIKIPSSNTNISCISNLEENFPHSPVLRFSHRNILLSSSCIYAKTPYLIEKILLQLLTIFISLIFHVVISIETI